MLGNGGNGRDILSMNQHEKQRRMAPLRNVEAYWHGLCDKDQVPMRSQVDPRGIEDSLENAFLMERIAPSMAKIRVAGSHLSDLMGMQIAGMPLSSLIAPADRDRFGQAVSRLFADPAIIRLELRAEGGFGKPDLEGHMILMPLRSDFGDLSRALGAIVTNGRVGRTPRRFTVTSIDITPALQPGVIARRPAPIAKEPAPEVKPLRSLRDMIKSNSVDATPVKPVPGINTQVKTPAKKAPQSRGHLRLIVSND